MTENAISKELMDAAFRIHIALGPGLPVYHAVLAYELAQRGLQTVSQEAIPVVYGTIRIDIGFRADLPASSMGWKKNLSQSRQDAKKTTEATELGVSSV